MEHGMNCPHHADKDEACTCALTERTMHAAWRKRAEEAETSIASLEAQVKTLTAERDAAFVGLEAANLLIDILTKERDAAEEAVRVLGKAVLKHHNDSAKFALRAEGDIAANPIAAAAVKHKETE